MATLPEHVEESRGRQTGRQWAGVHDTLEKVSPVAIVGAYLIVYTVVLGGAAFAAISLAALVDGPLGLVAFFFVGIGLVALAPTAAQILLLKTVDALRIEGKQ